MKFKEIAFSDQNASRIYKDYISRVQLSTKILSPENREEILMEINSHIYESFHNNTEDQNDVEKLLNILDKIGKPELFLKELVAEKKLEESTKSFNPISIFKALILNLGNGFSYVLFFILYLSLFSFVFLIFAKLFDPKNVGFFYKANDFFILGKLSLANENHQQYEYLGNWFIPAMIVITILFYFILTLLLKLKKSLNKQLK